MFQKIALVICVLAVCGVATAAPVTSVNNGLWTNPSTWDLGVPTSADSPFIANGKTVTVNSAITTGAGKDVSIGDWYNTSGKLVIASGELKLTEAGMYVGLGGNGELDMQGGHLVVPYGLRCGFYGTAIVNITGGTMDLGALYVGVASSGTMNIQGGIVNSWGELVMNIGGGTGHINITGGKLMIPGTVTNITTYGDVKAYAGSGTFVYDAITNPGYTVISAVIPEPTTIVLFSAAVLFARKRK